MENPVFRDEFIREQARIAARTCTGSQQKKTRLWLAWLPMLALFGYSFYVLDDFAGIDLRVLVHTDFLVAAGLLTGIFVLSLRQR